MGSISDESVIVGVDVGGTFTDLFLWDYKAKTIRIGKVLSNVHDQSIGIINALKEVEDSLEDVEFITHGTTVATNAAIERKGARCALITTKGFKDVIELKRRDRPTLFGMKHSWEPLIPRHRRYEVDERVTSKGKILQEVSEQEIKEIAQELIDKKIECAVIAFFDAYANPFNEKKAAELLRKYWSEGYIIIATDVVSEHREFERMSTAVTNAYVQPKVDSYLMSLVKRLKEGGFKGDVSIVHSSGGIMSLEVARKFPVRTLLSGPSAGVVVASFVGSAMGYKNIISGDMGGTSFDAALIEGGEPRHIAYKDLSYGVPLLVPQIDMTTIGAGGGSIAYLDRGGILRVGPESAGADPGPVCYAKGGKEPTVTDANLVLGRINVNNPIGKAGELTLSTDFAREAIKRKIADPLGLSIEEAAIAIIEVVNANMARNIRLISISRGHDIREFALMMFGGAGPLHANALLRELGANIAVIPPHPGIFCAMGCMMIPFQYSFVRGLNEGIDALDMGEVYEVFADYAQQGRDLIEEKKEFIERVIIECIAEMQYKRQTHTIRVPLPFSVLSKQELIDRFNRVYMKERGDLMEGVPITVISLRTIVTGIRPSVDLSMLAPGNSGLSIEKAKKGSTKVYFQGEYIDCDILERKKLPVGAIFDGPAIIEEIDTTTWIEPDSVAEVVQVGSIIIRRKK